MGLFWDYFLKKLRFPLIWKPGPMAQVAKGGAEALDAAREDCLWIRKQFTPQLCEDEYLEKHGKSRRMPRLWKETDEMYRERVTHAWDWHYWGGREKGIIDSLNRVIDKPFELTFGNQGGWEIGESEFGYNSFMGSHDMDYVFIVEFSEPLDEDEYKRVIEALMDVKAGRDIFLIIQAPTDWEIGVSELGYDSYVMYETMPILDSDGAYIADEDGKVICED